MIIYTVCLIRLDPMHLKGCIHLCNFVCPPHSTLEALLCIFHLSQTHLVVHEMELFLLQNLNCGNSSLELLNWPPLFKALGCWDQFYLTKLLVWAKVLCPCFYIKSFSLLLMCTFCFIIVTETVCFNLELFYLNVCYGMFCKLLWVYFIKESKCKCF